MKVNQTDYFQHFCLFILYVFLIVHIDPNEKKIAVFLHLQFTHNNNNKKTLLKLWTQKKINDSNCSLVTSSKHKYIGEEFT